MNTHFIKSDSPSLSRVLTCGRIASVLIGLFFLTAYAQADVSFNGTTFTGNGEYDQPAGTADEPLTANLTVTADADASTITLSGGVYTTGNLTHNKGKLIIASETTNSVNKFQIQKGGANGTTANIEGVVNANTLTVNGTGSCTSYLNISGELNVSGYVEFNGKSGGQGILNQTGGTVNFTTSTDQNIRIGHFETGASYPARYNLSAGTFNALNATTYVGWNGPGELNISGGEANLKGIQLVGGWNSTTDYAKDAKGTINLTGGKLNIGANGITLKNSRHAINLGDGTIGALASHTWASTLTVTLTSGKTPTFDIDANKTITINSKIAGSGGLKKTGDGTLTLTARNTFSGGTTVSAGKIISKADNAKASAFGTGAILVESGATLEFQVSNQLGYDANAPNDITIKGTLIPSNYTHVKNITLQNGVIESEYGYSSGGSGLDFGTRTATVTSTGNSIIKSRFTINSGAKPTFYVQSGTLTIEGVIKSDGGFTKTGDGTLTLSGANTYTGTTAINGGVLQLTDAAVVVNGPVSIGENGTLEFNLAEGQTKQLTFTDSNKITGSGTIIKTGEGVLQLYAAAEGLIDSSQFIVSSGRLDMKEYFKGSMEVGEALDDGYTTATFSPGNSVGTLIIDGAFKINGGSTLLIEQDTTGMDKLVANSFDVASDSILELTLGAAVPGATYAIIQDSDSELAGVDFWNSILAPESSYYWNLSVDGNTLYATLDANAVPEPSTWALLILGTAGLFWLRRKNSLQKN
jgi:autotransporter-associated beta strand protein